MIKKVISSLFVLTVFTLLSAGAALAEWPMFMSDAVHSSMARRSPRPPLQLKWQFTTGAAVNSSPAVYGGKVFVGSNDGKFYAIDERTGEVAWSYETGGEILSAPAVDRGTVYFGSKDGKVYAIEASTGKLKWSYDTGEAIMTSPLVAEGQVFIASDDLHFYALDARTGAKNWRFKLTGYEKYSGIFSSPVYYKGAVYIAGKNGLIYSMSAKSGGRNWQRRTFAAVYGSPTINDGVYYIATYGRKLFAYDAESGKVIWRKALGPDEYAYSSPVIEGSRIYLALKNGRVKIFNKRNGADVSVISLPGGISSTPAVTNAGYIFVGCDDGNLYALDTIARTVAWKYKTGGEVHSSPAVTADAVYVGSKDGSVYAFGR